MENELFNLHIYDRGLINRNVTNLQIASHDNQKKLLLSYIWC